MKNLGYQIQSYLNFSSFSFTSVGPKGTIEKIIQFQPTELENVYNLAFGDRIGSTEEFDDLSISNNGDTEQTLSTVANSVYIFLHHHPTALVYAAGSTLSRTRLYQIGIAKYRREWVTELAILGETPNGWQTFETGINYTGFLVMRIL